MQELNLVYENKNKNDTKWKTQKKNISGTKLFSDPCLRYICEKSFKHKVYLKRHEMLHTGLSPFACDICGKGFARKDKLKSHILALHTQNETPSTSQLPSGAFKCDICFEIFPSTSQLDRHQNFHKVLIIESLGFCNPMAMNVFFSLYLSLINFLWNKMSIID